MKREVKRCDDVVNQPSPGELLRALRVLRAIAIHSHRYKRAFFFYKTVIKDKLSKPCHNLCGLYFRLGGCSRL